MAIKKAQLTKKKKKWVRQRDTTGVIRGKALRPNVKAQARYRRRLENLTKQMIKETEREFKKLFECPDAEEFFAEDISISSQSKILANKLSEKFEKLFNLSALPITNQLINAENKQSKSSMSESLKQLSGGLTIKTSFMTEELREIIKASSAESASLIKSVPSQYFLEVEGAVMRSITTGNGLQDLIPFFNKRADITERRVKNLALDQTRKVYNNINKGRMEALGINSYEWVHSGGGSEPRPHHINQFPNGLNGGIFKFDDPPVIDPKTGQKGKPGDLINCRCTMRPVMIFDDGEREDD